MIRKTLQKKPIEQTEFSYISELGLLDEHSKRFEVMIPNFFITSYHEADLLGVRRSGFIDEFEIKLSKRDFAADRRKTLSLGNSGDNYKLNELEKGNTIINHFWYVVPEGMINREEIPSFAGLIEIGTKVRIISHPKRLHSRKLSFEERYNLTKKASNRYWGLVKKKLNPECRNLFTADKDKLESILNDARAEEWNDVTSISVDSDVLITLAEFALKHTD